VRRGPVSERLRPGRLGKEVVARPEGGDEELRLADLTRGGIDHRDGLPGVVDEDLLARLVLLAQHRVARLLPRAEAGDKLRVLVAVRVIGLVLEPQELERHAAPAQLLLDVAPLRQRAQGTRGRRGREEPRPKLGVVPRRGGRVIDPRTLGARQIATHGDVAHTQALADPAAAQSLSVEPQHFSNLAHGHPLCRHDPLLGIKGPRREATAIGGKGPAPQQPRGGQLGAKCLVSLLRNGWSASTEMSGKLAAKWVVTLVRNAHYKSHAWRRLWSPARTTGASLAL
jgi:hypothetical protein